MERWAGSLLLAAAFAAFGLKRRSLSPSGALAAMAVGTVHMACGLELGGTLILFYLSSSKLTKLNSSLKARLEAGHAVGGQRGAAQVLANSLLGAALAAALAWVRATGGSGLGGGGLGSFAGGSCEDAVHVLAAAFVAFYACCAADTWSSEVGIASRSAPRLITTGRRVPPGTNGGISLLGTAAAAAGGLFVGCCYTALALLSAALPSGPNAVAAAAASGCPAAAADWRLVPLSLVAGLGGSLLDSLLGATVQWSGFDARSCKAVSGRPSGAAAEAAGIKHTCGRDLLTNTGVNVCSSLLSSALAAAAWARWLAS